MPQAPPGCLALAGGRAGGAPTASLCLLSVRLSVRGQGAASPHVSPVPSASICLHEGFSVALP